jgi:hypothetical protein
MANGWGVFDLDGNEVFDVDSCVEIKYSGKAKTSNFPVEEGAFASYNKVKEPIQYKVSLAVSGEDRCAAFEADLEEELSAANLYNIATPTMTYMNVTLDGYNISHTAGNINALTVELSLLEVREVTPSYTTVTIPKPKKPTSASAAGGGKGNPSAPNQPPTRTFSGVIAQADSDSNS